MWKCKSSILIHKTDQKWKNLLGAQCFCRNEETSPDEPVEEEEEEEEEKEEEEEQARGLFSQATANIISFFGR